MDMDNPIKGSDGHTYELKDATSISYHTGYESATYETLETINSDTMRPTQEYVNSTGCDHSKHLLKTDTCISNKAQLLLRIVKVSFLALLLVALAVVSSLFLTSRSKDNGIAQCFCHGNWNDLSEIQPAACGIPNIPRNGYLEYINETTASVTCAQGFDIIGNTNVLCLKNGSWSWAPKCHPISCGFPEKPLNGTVNMRNGTTYQKIGSIKCNTGFILKGASFVKCLSNGKWTQGAKCTPTVTDCYDIHIRSNTTPNGIYNITLWKSKKTIQVYCDMKTDGGGWTVFQNRYDGSVDFLNSYAQYENGFGNISSEFWLGLGHIHEMSTQGRTKMRIVITAANGTTTYTQFLIFYLSSRDNGYMLNFGGVSGCKSTKSYWTIENHNGVPFSTFDYSSYGNPGISVAIRHHGGWWYSPSNSIASNLNGRYAEPGSFSNDGMFYNPFKSSVSLKASKMMFKRF